MYTRCLHPICNLLQNLGIGEMCIIEARSIYDTSFVVIQVERHRRYFRGTRFLTMTDFSLLNTPLEDMVDELNHVIIFMRIVAAVLRCSFQRQSLP
jgi:hypothetical protein